MRNWHFCSSLRWGSISPSAQVMPPKLLCWARPKLSQQSCSKCPETFPVPARRGFWAAGGSLPAVPSVHPLSLALLALISGFSPCPLDFRAGWMCPCPLQQGWVLALLDSDISSSQAGPALSGAPPALPAALINYLCLIDVSASCSNVKRSPGSAQKSLTGPDTSPGQLQPRFVFVTPAAVKVPLQQCPLLLRWGRGRVGSRKVEEGMRVSQRRAGNGLRG